MWTNGPAPITPTGGRTSNAADGMAPNDRAEREEDLSVLESGGPLAPEEYHRLAEHGRCVRRHAGGFP